MESRCRAKRALVSTHRSRKAVHQQREAAAADALMLNAAVRSAAAAYPAWAATGPGRRRELLLRAADALLAHQAEFVECMIAETGATEGWAGFNVVFGASILREAASMTSQIIGRGHSDRCS